mmetsp:Transcript_58254/g.137328  ORF Transcript_58254/g.137328 Transcript_58254/m.137328 type:complete len:134 (+) Transcript_58254:52-453(+)
MSSTQSTSNLGHGHASAVPAISVLHRPTPRPPLNVNDAAYGHHGSLQTALNQGADPDTDAAIVAAAENGYLDCVVLLLDAKADVDARGPYGNTALQGATKHGYDEIVQTLLAAGAKDEGGPGPGTLPMIKAAN